MLIRNAHAHDAPAILKLIQALAQYEKLLDEVVATEADIRSTLFSENPQAEVILAEEGGTLVGFALFFHNYSSFLARKGIHLEDLFVLPEHRGKGVGKKLLIHLAQLSRERRCGRLEWNVLDWNQSAIDFYKKMGATPLRNWFTFRLDSEGIDQFAPKDSPKEERLAPMSSPGLA